MKKTLLFIFILCAANSYSELKHFLPRSNAVMSILDKKYWFEGDTIIDNTRYTKVYRQFCSSETECGDLFYYAAVREDTIAEKIYCVWENDPLERLIADFDVKAGDEITIYSKNWGGERPVEIKEVDSLRIDNAYRKRINLVDKYYEDTDSWVEGMGSVVYGLFFPSPTGIADAGDTPQFLCLHINERLVYQNPNYTSCFVEDSGTENLYELCIEDCMKSNPGKTYSDCAFYCLYWYWNGISEIDRNEINIYPSPANDILRIETNGKCYLCRIYNSQGTLIRTGVLQGEQVDISTFTSGIYFIVLYSENNRPVVVRKFIKH